MQATQSPSQPSAYASWDAAISLSKPWIEATTLGTLINAKEGQTLYTQGAVHDFFYLLRSGFVHTTMLRPNGSEMLLEIFGPGALFGEGPAYSGLPRSVSAHCVTDATLSRYSLRDVEAVMPSQPELAVSLLRLMGFKTHSLLRKLSRFTSQEPQERILELLTRVARLDAVTAASRHSSVQLTHKQIAAMTALSRITVTRALKVLAKLGLIETELGQVLIKDKMALLALAEGSSKRI